MGVWRNLFKAGITKLLGQKLLNELDHQSYNERFKILKVPSLRTHHWVVLSAWTSKLITAVIQIAIIRIVIERIGIDLYAALALLTGMAGWYVLADFGIGNSLQNHISESRARGASANSLIVTSLASATLSVACLMLLLYALSPYLGSLLLRNIAVLDTAGKGASFFWFGIISLLSTTSGIVYKIWYATQKGYWANILPALASVAGLLLVTAIPDAPPTQQMLWCLVSINAPNALLPVLPLLYQGYKAYISGGRYSIGDVILIMSRASKFLGFAVMSAFILQIDYIVISQYLSPSDITVYNIATKIFGTAYFVYYSFLLAIWPLFTELITKREWQTVLSHIKRSIVGGVIFMIAVTLLVLWFERGITSFLTRSPSLAIDSKIIVFLGLYFIVRIWTDISTTVLVSISHLRTLLIWVPVQAVLNVCFQLYLAPRYGTAGVIAGLIASFLLTVAWALPLQVYRRLVADQGLDSKL